ncbi:cytochrome c oxidase cbb3-type subunit 3 [Flavobacterium micromati]|uniref:Cytochrome c oxidase cbb3-type subunit 3 n=1 Tax=Flavobacterium micromati TaxID=229205 RepID=A0A1M5PSV6_9FLAO|nr:cbb3-type cytochrome c oxidase N-terminal domain-containing protein [Flavobacterium micromati]SHH04848.1 cytochrome c oxidase cbb3-type subunit 3 [Flavobacterium micromati]
MKKLIPSYLSVPFIFFAVFAATEFFIDSGERPAFIKFPMVTVFLLVFLFIIIAIEITITAVNNVTYYLLTAEEKAKLNESKNWSLTENKWYKKLVGLLIKPESSAEVSEDQLLLDHDYDGIKELDNNLPPWWVYLFYASIVFGVVYMVRFEILGADNQEMELKKEIAQAKIEVAEYMKTAPDMMDEKTVTLLTEAGDLATGKEIFNTNCAACHRTDGGGQIGPNLTDNQWILGGGIKNIFHTLVNGGRDGKGMISWKGTLKPKEMQKVASYVISLNGTNPPDAKAPEGEVYVE